MHMFKQLMVRPDLQQLASNPLILSMCISHIRSASKSNDKVFLNRWKLYHAAMTTIITRLDVAYGSRGHGGVPMIIFEFMKNGMAYTRAEDGDSFCSPIHEDDIAEQVQNLILKADVPAPIVNLGGDQVVSVEEIIGYVEGLTGLQMKVETGKDASWGMKVLDNTRRKALGGPCKVDWKEGVRAAIAKRYPDAIRD